MTVEPADTPVTVNPADAIVATPVLVLLQVPPAGELDNTVVLLLHNVVVPVIALGNGLTVNVTCAGVHPGIVYEITEVAGAPVTPVLAPTRPGLATLDTVATVVVALVQVPPETVLVN